MSKFFGKIKNRIKSFFNKDYLSYSFHKYKAFTALQMKEVFARESSTNNPVRDRVISIVSPIIRFVVVFALAFGLCFLNEIFYIIQPLSMYYLIVFFVSVISILQLISSTAGCTKAYYIAEDNKVLITFPSTGASLFLSKLTVEFVKELKNTAGLMLPVVMGIVMFNATVNRLAPMSFISVIWLIIPIIILCAIIVLLGSLLSVLYLQYLRIVKTFPVIRLIVLAAIFGGLVYLAVVIINKIPPDIELRLMWNQIKAGIDGFLKAFTKIMVPFDYICSSFCGFTGVSYRGYKLTGISFARFALLFAALIILFILVFVIIKKLFLHMMTKSVDYEKVKENIEHKNHVHHRESTFAIKELKISLRTLEISGTYVVTYVVIPVLILLLCKVFDAINTSMKGDMLTIMFNVLLISLPLLASNTPISSAYSREGHAGYIKKTKPVKPYIPMLSKLLFNLVLSIPSIFASVFIVGKFGKIDVGSVILVGISILFVQYAHIFYSSTLDFTKPRNESYQTEGQDAKNPNENASTVMAFAMSFIFAILVFFFFKEQVTLEAKSFIKAAVRVFAIAAVIFASAVTLYFLKLKAYFMEK